MCGTDREFDLDEALWLPGIDYVAGWREAQDACDALVAALSEVWPDTERATATALSAADGSGMVRLRISSAAARALADLICSGTPGHDAPRAES